MFPLVTTKNIYLYIEYEYITFTRKILEIGIYIFSRDETMKKSGNNENSVSKVLNFQRL